MEAKLIVVGGKANKDTVTLNSPTVIGRSRAAELTVAHPMISRKHCQIFEVDGLLMIRDLGSLNGTVVQGQRVTEAPLCPHDEFTVGPLTFRVEYEYDGDLDAVPDPQLYEGPAPQPEVDTGEEVPDFAAVGEVPDSAFIEAAGNRAAGEGLSDSGAWDELVMGAAVEPQEEEAVDEVEDLTEFETLEDESEAEEPEPTPPPPLRKKPADKEAADKEAAGGPRQARTAADSQSTEQPVEELSDFFAAMDPDADQPDVAKTSDDDLDDFLKGLE